MPQWISRAPWPCFTASVVPLLLLLLPVTAPNAGAQVVHVELVEDVGRAPLPGAIVRLMRADADVAQALTSASGRAVIRAPGPGTYHVRINRIGYRAMSSEPFTVAAGQTVRRVVAMSAVRVALPAVLVQQRGRCSAGVPEGTAAVAIWEEIRSALTASVLTVRQRATPLRVESFRRTLDRGGDVQQEWVVSDRIWYGPPFATFPAESLAARGFVFDAGDGALTFAAPDAALLLSDAFVSTHCFWAVTGREPLVGLAFEPLSGRRVPDVRGTLWVHRESSELQSLEFTYTGLPADLRPNDLGGRLEFRRLPTGAWVVSYWHIRMPQVETSAGEFSVGGGRLPHATRGGRRTVIGFNEHGGRAILAGERAAAAALVMGRVVDSTSSAGLSGAVVRIRGEPDSVITDEQGHYQLSVAAVGSRTIVASHPRLGHLGDDAERAVSLAVGDSTIVDFAVPPLSAFSSASCGNLGMRAGLVGIASGTDGTPQAGLEIRVSWEPRLGVIREDRARSGPRGLYVLCNLQGREVLTIRLHRASPGPRGSLLGGGSILLEETVRLDAGEFRWVDLNPATAGSNPAHAPSR